MRSARWLLGIVGVVVGCGGAEPVSPVAGALAIHVVGDPPLVAGKIVVEVTAPAAVVLRGVDLFVRGVKAGTAASAPYRITLDSAAFADGPATLEARAVVDGTGGAESGALAVTLANFAPVITVLGPTDGATLVGSPSKGFSVKPLVLATDGNGVASLWAEVGGATIDLGAGDGSVVVPLGNIGTEFPRAAVPIILHARDTTGAVGTAVLKVVPSPVKVRFERPSGGAVAPLNALDILADGRPLIQLGASLLLLPEPSLTVAPTLTFDKIDAFARSGDGLFITAHDASTQQLELLFSTLAGPTKTLFSLSPDHAATTFDPFLHSSGKVFASWVDLDTLDTHLFAYTPDGKAAFETVYPKTPLLDQVTEAHDGALLTVAAPPGAVSGFVQPFDPVTGAAQTAWQPPASSFALVDALGAVVLYYTSAVYGTPIVHFASFGPGGGAPEWDAMGDETFPQLMRRRPDGSVLTYLFATTAGIASRLSTLGKGGEATLWSGALDTVDTLLGPRPGTSDSLIERYSATTAKLSVFVLHEDGTVGWAAPLPGDTNATVQVLTDGSVLGVAADPSAVPAAAKAALVGPDGKLVWSAKLEAAKLMGVAEVDGLLVLAESGGAMQPFAFEALDRKTGARVWRYREGLSPDVFGKWVMGKSEPWGVLLTSLVRASPDPGNSTFTSVVLGLVP